MGSIAPESKGIDVLPDVQPIAVTKLSARAQWAQLAIRKNIAEVQSQLNGLPVKANAYNILPVANTLHQKAAEPRKLKVGIIGAGVSGLFTAMLLNHLKDTFGLDVEWEILEANGEDRLGGRLYTYKFEDGDANDYYDVGAMRFPEIDIMERTFGLFEHLGMHKYKPSRLAPDPSELPEPGQLIPYYLTDDKQHQLFLNNTALYNGRQINVSKTEPTASNFKIGPDYVPEHLQDETPGSIFDEAIDWWMTQYNKLYLKGKQKVFWDLLMKQGDNHTVRSFLKNYHDYNTIEFLETLNFGNRWYDQAFSEAILEALDFDAKAEWWCVQGGSNQIVQRIVEQKLGGKGNVKFNHKVTGMRYLYESDRPEVIDKVEVDVKGKRYGVYDAVFNSTTLGAMQHMHLEGLNLNWGTKQAIRSLGYGASCKVGVRFSRKWWMAEPYNIKMGGVSKTDLPIRCCVYPSYNIRSAKDQTGPNNIESPGTLLVSYTWSQEAERIGALIARKQKDGTIEKGAEEELRELIIHDLARLHTNDDEEYQKLSTELGTWWLDHYAYDWYADPNTVGAFAYFGPQQFSNMYQWITRSNGVYMMIGEAASAHHAWVVGSLESAVRGVYQFLYKHDDIPACRAAADAYTSWTKDSKVLPTPFGPLPYEYDRTADTRYMDEQTKEAVLESDKFPTDHKDKNATPSPMGEWARMQVLIENLRLEDPKQKGDQIQGGEAGEVFLQPIVAATTAIAA